jgi:hypothetical protein
MSTRLDAVSDPEPELILDKDPTMTNVTGPTGSGFTKHCLESGVPHAGIRNELASLDPDP